MAQDIVRIVILGAGGHAEVVADILEAMARCNRAIVISGFLDDDERLWGVRKPQGMVLGRVSDLRHIAHDAIVIGIGNNRVRFQLYADMMARGERLLTVIHPSAVISPHADIAAGVVVCAGVIVGPGAVVGPNAILNTACSIDHHNSIGAHAHIGPGVRLGGDVIIGLGALIGIGAAVMPQRSVGEWSTVGAGALVDRDVEARQTVVGVPARPIHP